MRYINETKLTIFFLFFSFIYLFIYIVLLFLSIPLKYYFKREKTHLGGKWWRGHIYYMYKYFHLKNQYRP